VGFKLFSFTHWVASTNFIGQFLFPTFRAFRGAIFPVPGKSLVEGVSAKSSHYSCRKNFFLGSYLEEIGVNHPKKVFPARIMHFAEIPGTISSGNRKKKISFRISA
jgi:hypothetical protein